MGPEYIRVIIDVQGHEHYGEVSNADFGGSKDAAVQQL